MTELSTGLSDMSCYDRYIPIFTQICVTTDLQPAKWAGGWIMRWQISLLLCVKNGAHVSRERIRTMPLAYEDITVSVQHSQLLDYLNYGIRRYELDPSGFSSTAFDPALVRITDYMDTPNTYEQAAATSRYVLRAYQWCKSFMDKAQKYAIDPNWDGTHTAAGISYQLTPRHISDIFRVTPEAFYRNFAGVLAKRPDISNDDYLQVVPADPHLTDVYIGNPQYGILQRATWLAKRKQLRAFLNNLLHETTDGDGNTYHYLQRRDLTLSAFRNLEVALADISQYKPDAHYLFSLRSELLQSQGNAQRIADSERRSLAGKKFATYWAGIKDSRPAQSVESATESWATIPLLPQGMETSRTWGIEIETVRANETSRPAGWEAVYDGSLPGSGGDCDCDCDSCYNDDHCSEDGYCNYDSTSESQEFVSPVLRHYNSAGLRMLCNDLGTDPDESSAPGIHVHIGAQDLTVFDVTRLLIAYSAVNRLIDPILHRKSYGYCNEMDTTQLQYWLGKLREWQRRTPDAVPTPADVINMDGYAARNRYVDLNLQALTKHGTIEFRSMGAWYDYEHLVRWAWFLREIVNVSKLGIDQREWTACKSLDDVTNLLRKYGSELPDSQLFADKAPMFAELTEA